MTADGSVIKEPCILFTISGAVSTTGSVGVLYNAQSAKTGKEIADLKALANEHRQLQFGPRGILCDSGLYVDMGSNGIEMLIVFDPIYDPQVLV